MSPNIDLTPLIIDGIQEKKGHGITLLDLSSIEGASTGSFIICEGNNPTQVAAIADSIRDAVSKGSGRKPYSNDGYGNSSWIVIDYGEVVVHVFLPDERRRYDLEELWSDAPISKIEDIDPPMTPKYDYAT